MKEKTHIVIKFATKGNLYKKLKKKRIGEKGYKNRKKKRVRQGFTLMASHIIYKTESLVTIHT